MTELLVILLLLALVGVGFALYKQRQSSPASATPAPRVAPRDPLANLDIEGAFWELKAGDVVKFDDTDYFIRRSIRNVQGPYTWFEHRLDDGFDKAFWLSVEDDEGLDLGVWNKIDLVDVKDGALGDPAVVVNGKAFKLIDNGVAEWSSYKSDENGAGSIEHYQYRAADATMLSAQNYDEQGWEVSLGQKHRAHEFEIFSAADPSSNS